MPLPKRPYNYELVDGLLPTLHPLYRTWHNMMRRCYCECDRAYVNYGARGVSVDESWWIFKNFVSDMGSKPKGFTLERIDNDGNYCKSNCKWVAKSEQSKNRRVFKNSTTGHEGVLLLTNGTYIARINRNKVRYTIGRYKTLEEAVESRSKFLKLYKENPESAINSISKETLWNTSSTGMRGISVHPDGGYIVRVTENGKRVYLGYYQYIEDAIDAKINFRNRS